MSVRQVAGVDGYNLEVRPAHMEYSESTWPLGDRVQPACCSQ